MQSNIYNNLKNIYQEANLEELSQKLSIKEAALAEYVNKLFEQEERWITVSNILKNINAQTNVIELTNLVCKEIQKITNVDFCSAAIFDVKQSKFEQIISLPKIEDKIVTLKFEEFLETFKRNFDKKKNKLKDKSLSSFFKSTSNSYILPMFLSDNLMNVIYIYSKVPFYSNNSISVIDIICDNYKQAIERISLYQKLQSASRHKTEFIAKVTHEFKTPLNAIIGFAELMKQQKFSKEKSQKFINNIITNSHHILRLIEDILDVSKLELNNIDLVYENCNPKDLIEQVVSILESMYISKNITLKSQLVDVNIKIDKMRFKQIIYNLINNAIKFTPPNGKITILTYIDSNKFWFEISDTGCGISEDFKDKIFDMFTQAGDDVLKKGQGHGLGLFICKNLVKLHNGSITFSNNPTSGCTFKFFVPI